MQIYYIQPDLSSPYKKIIFTHQLETTFRPKP